MQTTTESAPPQEIKEKAKKSVAAIPKKVPASGPLVHSTHKFKPAGTSDSTTKADDATPPPSEPTPEVVSTTASGVPATSKELSKQERKDFARLRKVIHEGVTDIALKGFKVGAALLEIQQRKLYRKDYGSFESYCAKELEIARSRAYELLNAAQVQKELSAMADTIVQPVNERQIRPLVPLKTADKRVAAWKRALVIAGTKPVSEADVRKAVKELSPPKAKEADVIPAPTWTSNLIKALLAVGYERAFEQLANWRVDAFHLYLPSSKRYVRLIEKLTLEEAGCAKAIRDAGVACTFVANADANAPDGLQYSENEIDLVGCFPPEFELIASDIGLLVEDDGTFYSQGKLDARYQAVWTPLPQEKLDALGLPAPHATDEATVGSAPSPAEGSATNEDEDAGDEPAEGEASSEPAPSVG